MNFQSLLAYYLIISFNMKLRYANIDIYAAPFLHA